MKRLAVLLLVCILALSCLSCQKQSAEENLKYIFMFIGDGMSFNAVQLARDVKGVEKNRPEELSFTDFDSAGIFTNYDKTSFIPDSASSGTAMATGVKVPTGSVSMTESGRELDSIATILKNKLGMKIGIITTANINHATPSVFYAHSNSRYSYREVGESLAESDFDFFAGGEFLDDGGDGESLVSIAEKGGYTVLDTEEEIKSIDKSNKNLIISPDCDSTGMIGFNIDRPDDSLSLSDYLETAIKALDNENGFFIMCEGGRIDSALHANDAKTAVEEINELSDAVQAALDFYKKHPDETLIIVTGDHETGGLSLGYTGTGYSLSLKELNEQKISYLAFEAYVKKYIAEGTPFEDILLDTEKLFGLDGLSDYEYQQLENAWKATLSESQSASEENYIKYSSRTPLTVEATRLVAHRAGIAFSTFVHTAAPMPLWAKGVGEESFAGTYDNTDVYNKLYALLDK